LKALTVGSGSRSIEAHQLFELGDEPRRAILGWLGASAVGAAIATIPFAPRTLDPSTSVTLCLLGLAIVSAASLPLYVDLGLTLLKLGEEARVPLATFDLEGRPRKKLRHAHKKGVEAGCSFEIRPPGAGAQPIEELTAISDDWLEHKGAREKGFSLGYFDPAYLARTPIATVSCGGRIVAFANLWPGAPGTEMSLDLMRYHRDAPAGVMDYLFLELLLWARQEGYAWFNLGMAPLSGLAGRALAPFWTRLGSTLYRHGEAFYNFQGLRQYKEKFDPVWEPRYLAAPGGLVLPRVLGDLATLIGGGLRGALGR
jgi:phosphatidylglycerol lysyltransferase